jgi:GNAT superfamily N-acetyltransferase
VVVEGVASKASPHGVSCRPATAADLPAIAALLDARNREEGLKNTSGVAGAHAALLGLAPTRASAVVAEQGSVVVGLSGLWHHTLQTPAGDVAAGYWVHLVVAPALRGKGVFGALVTSLRALAATEHRLIWCLMRREGVLKAQQKLGFIPGPRLSLRARPLLGPTLWPARALSRSSSSLAPAAFAAARSSREFASRPSTVARLWSADEVLQRLQSAPDGASCALVEVAGAAAAWRLVRRRGVLGAVILDVGGAGVWQMAQAVAAAEVAAHAAGARFAVVLDGQGPTLSRALTVLGYLPTTAGYTVLVDGQTPSGAHVARSQWRVSLLDHDAF